MEVDTKLECKKMLFQRCLKSVALSIMVQLELVALFAIIVNFDIFQPITSIWSTLNYISSFGTWFSLAILIVAVVIYFVLLQKYILSPKKYYPTRMSWLWAKFIPKSLFLLLHLCVGYFSVLHHSRYLHLDYQNLINKCFEENCFNNYYFFIMCSALFATGYYFFKEHARKDPILVFPIVQERTLVRIKSMMFFNCKGLLKDSLLPFVYFIITYCLIGWLIRLKFANLIGLENDSSIGLTIQMITNVRLMFYTILFMAQILGNLHLMEKFSSILLTEEVNFTIDCSPRKDVYKGITLVDALCMTELPIMPTLAALNMYNISNSKSKSRRLEMFALTLPGGHPHNWSKLAEASLKVINEYTNELVKATDKSRTLQKAWYQSEKSCNNSWQDEKVRLRQFNQAKGIRMLSEDFQEANAAIQDPVSPHQSHKAITGDTIDQFSLRFYQEMVKLWKHFVTNFPGLSYLFAEKETSKINFLLENSQTIIFLTQGLGGICAASKSEDSYGVVQINIPEIIHSLLSLRQELEKLQNCFLIGKEMEGYQRLLNQAVKRSLFTICDAFGDFLEDLVSDVNEFRQIKNFLSMHEI